MRYFVFCFLRCFTTLKRFLQVHHKSLISNSISWMINSTVFIWLYRHCTIKNTKKDSNRYPSCKTNKIKPTHWNNTQISNYTSSCLYTYLYLYNHDFINMNINIIYNINYLTLLQLGIQNNKNKKLLPEKSQVRSRSFRRETWLYLEWIS